MEWLSIAEMPPECNLRYVSHIYGIIKPLETQPQMDGYQLDPLGGWTIHPCESSKLFDAWWWIIEPNKVNHLNHIIT